MSPWRTTWMLRSTMFETVAEEAVDFNAEVAVEGDAAGAGNAGGGHVFDDDVVNLAGDRRGDGLAGAAIAEADEDGRACAFALDAADADVAENAAIDGFEGDAGMTADVELVGARAAVGVEDILDHADAAFGADFQRVAGGGEVAVGDGDVAAEVRRRRGSPFLMAMQSSPVAMLQPVMSMF